VVIKMKIDASGGRGEPRSRCGRSRLDRAFWGEPRSRCGRSRLDRASLGVSASCRSGSISRSMSWRSRLSVIVLKVEFKGNVGEPRVASPAWGLWEGGVCR